MFWRVAGLATASPVDGILDRDHYTLEELLDEDDLIQECKSLNSRLITFLHSKDQVMKMMQYVVEQPPDGSDDKRTYKFPFVSCEVFTCEIDQILNTVVEEPEIMDLLFAFPQPDRPHSNLLSGYFSKVVNSLLLRKTPEIMVYLQAHQGILKQLVDLIGTTSIMEVVMRLVGANDEILLYHSEKLTWLAETPLLDLLVEQLGPQTSSDVQANAAEVLSAIARTVPAALALKLATPAYVHKLFHHVLEEPRSMTSVINSLAVCVTLLGPRRQAAPGAHLGMGFRMGQGPPPEQSSDGLQDEAMVQTIRGMLDQLGPLLELLDASKDEKVLPTTYGQLHPPLGIHRLKVVEFIGVLLASQSEHAFEELIQSGGIKVCIDLLFRYHFNNFLHHQVERMVVTMLESGNPKVLEHLLVECELLNRILAAYEEPHAPDTRPEPLVEDIRAPARSGYMGHLTRIANRIAQLRSDQPALDALVARNEAWGEWQLTGLKRRNALENIHHWACGRPASLDDRPPDDEEDEFSRQQDRDFDIGSMSLVGGTVRSYAQPQFEHPMVEIEDSEESDTSMSSTEQGMTDLRIDDSSSASSSEVGGREGGDAAPEPSSRGGDSTEAAAAGLVSLMGHSPSEPSATAMDASQSLFTSTESGQTAWMAFQDQQQREAQQQQLHHHQQQQQQQHQQEDHLHQQQHQHDHQQHQQQGSEQDHAQGATGLMPAEGVAPSAALSGSFNHSPLLSAQGHGQGGGGEAAPDVSPGGPVPPQAPHESHSVEGPVAMDMDPPPMVHQQGPAVYQQDSAVHHQDPAVHHQNRAVHHDATVHQPGQAQEQGQGLGQAEPMVEEASHVAGASESQEPVPEIATTDPSPATVPVTATGAAANSETLLGVGGRGPLNEEASGAAPVDAGGSGSDGGMPVIQSGEGMHASKVEGSSLAAPAGTPDA